MHWIFATLEQQRCACGHTYSVRNSYTTRFDPQEHRTRTFFSCPGFESRRCGWVRVRVDIEVSRGTWSVRTPAEMCSISCNLTTHPGWLSNEPNHKSVWRSNAAVMTRETQQSTRRNPGNTAPSRRCRDARPDVNDYGMHYHTSLPPPLTHTHTRTPPDRFFLACFVALCTIPYSHIALILLLCFFSQGIFLSPLEEQSSRMFEFVFKMFSVGAASLPEGGMGQVPLQIAADLPEG